MEIINQVIFFSKILYLCLIFAAFVTCSSFMDKFLIKGKKKFKEETDSNHISPKKNRVELNLDDLPFDIGLRLPVSNYLFDDQDKIRKAYLQRPRCQPRQHNFPIKFIIDQN